MKLAIELEKNKREADWSASWGKIVAIAKAPEQAIVNLIYCPEVQEELNRQEQSDVHR